MLRSGRTERTRSAFLPLRANDGKITFHDSKAWEFDDGAVTVKSFSLDMEEGRPASRKRIETRIVVKQNDRWVGYTYVWNNEQTDATLVDGGRYRPDLFDQRPRQPRWRAPAGLALSRAENECMFCHSRAAGFVLGLTTPQMNRDHNYGADRRQPTSHASSHIGMFQESALPRAGRTIGPIPIRSVRPRT